MSVQVVTKEVKVESVAVTKEVKVESVAANVATLVEMFVADNGLWSPSVAGKKVASVMDTGDGYEWEVSPVSKEHDHSDAYVMMIMMNFLDSLNSGRSSYQIIKPEVRVKINA